MVVASTNQGILFLSDYRIVILQGQLRNQLLHDVVLLQVHLVNENLFDFVLVVISRIHQIANDLQAFNKNNLVLRMLIQNVIDDLPAPEGLCYLEDITA